jgi:NTE family protein
MKEVALALGGGGVRGIAHLGVIRRLEQEGYTIRAIAGTSAGGLVGAVYAAGNSPEKIENELKTMNLSNIFSRKSDDGPSIMGLNGVLQAVIKLIGDCTFDQLKIPFACTAVDLHTRQEIILSHGRVVDSVAATAAFPGIFPPKQIDGALLVDGGVMDPVPVSLARWLAPDVPIIAVCLSSAPEEWTHLEPFAIPKNTSIPAPIIEQIAKLRIAQAFQIFSDSMDISSRMVGELRMQIDQPDVIIRPDVERFGIISSVNPSELIMLGELATLPALPILEKKLRWSNKMIRRFRHGHLPGRVIALTTPPESLG